MLPSMRACVWAAAAAIVLGPLNPDAVHSQPPGRGPANPAMQADREVFHFLLDHRADVKRSIKTLPDGVETLTESPKPEVARKIQEHVAAMHERVKKGNGIHLRDPLFAEIFRHYDKISMTVEKTEHGVKVIEVSKDPWVARLIQAHADVVSKFIENGHAEMRKNHPLPEKQE